SRDFQISAWQNAGKVIFSRRHFFIYFSMYFHWGHNASSLVRHCIICGSKLVLIVMRSKKQVPPKSTIVVSVVYFCCFSSKIVVSVVFSLSFQGIPALWKDNKNDF
ncbi:hypothetical protein, partial [Bacteroides fluxus]|uniref:hypothetical protein n=1 Tax=Bacteroides fluxus TaxID=626930 RepID=UPI002A815306